MVSWRTDWQRELQPDRLFRGLTVGLINGISGMIQAVSMAALIFSGNLQQDLSLGIGVFLIGSILVRIVVTLFSSYAWASADIEESVAAVLSIAALSVSQSLPASGATATSTLFAVITLSSLSTGAFLFVLGQLRLGNLIRFIPYPVVGGFVAGIGCLLINGGFQVMTDSALSFALLPTLFQPDLLLRWLSGVGLSIFLLLVLRRYSHFLILPVCLLTASGLFYGVLWLTQTPLSEAADRGLLLGLADSGTLWQPPTLQAFTQVDWGVVAGQLGSIATIALLSSVGLLLNSVSIELATEVDIDLNRELQVTGIANLLTSLPGSMVGYSCVSDSILTYRMGARNRVPGLVAAGLLGLVLLLGTSFFSAFPRFILGGLLLLLGLEMLVEWVYDARSKLPLTDYSIVLVILVVSATVGFLQAVGVGMAIALVLFVITYSRIPVTRLSLSGAAHRSRVARPANQIKLLQQQGDQIVVLVLQGFLFFGTANRLLEQVRQRVENSNAPADEVAEGQRVNFVVLDFRLVNGIDTSAAVSFLKLRQLAQQQSFRLVFAGLSEPVRFQLQQRGCLEAEDPTCIETPDRDRALQWCEDRILETIPLRRRRSLPLALQLEDLFVEPENVSAFTSYLEEQDREAGEVVFRQGEPADTLYFIEVGEVTVLLEQDGQIRRLRSLGAGNLVGEMDFYLNTPHQTSASVDKSCTLYCLSRAAADQMRRQQPEVAATFQEYVIRSLSDRLAYSYREVSDLLQ